MTTSSEPNLPPKAGSAGADAPATPMVELIEDLLGNLESLRLALDTTDAPQARERRDRVALQVRNHLLPRLREVSAPAIVVFGGSTGAGKSTLVNSVVADTVSAAGVLRPTTREPVVVAHPKDAELLAGHPVLEASSLVENAGTTRGLALVDAPDLDSVHAANRSLADQLVEMADMWIFVTTGSRYGDALPWGRLRDAGERGISIAVVLNRVDPTGMAAIRADLFKRLTDQGLGSLPFFVVPDVGPLDGPLPPERVLQLSRFLGVLGAGSQSRSVIARTVRGAWPSLREDLQALASNLETQRRTTLSTQGAVQAATRTASTQAREDVLRGSAATGAPTTAWLAGASSGGALSALVTQPRGWLARRRARRAAIGRADALKQLRETSLAELRALLADAGATAERAIRTALAESGAGAQVAARVSAQDSVQAREKRLDLLFQEWRDVVTDQTPNLEPKDAMSGADLGHLIEAAAVGVDGAERAVARLAGDAGTTVVTAMRADLADWAAAAVTAEADDFMRALEGLNVDPPDAATTVRLRASELREYV